MNRIRRFVPLILILAILLTSSGSAHAQSTNVQFFAETGHSVKGIFLQFYNSAKDPKLVYGYPITEQMTSRDGKTVQYFQRARFESTSTQSVQLTALGSLIHKANSPLTINNPNACEFYPTGFPVCLTFLEFYKANGGPTQFGNPISPFELSEGLIVQYFEAARFEWHADRPSDQRVVISDLGRIYFDQLKEDPAQIKSIESPSPTINPVLSLKVRAFVLKAVTLRSGQQTVFIIVQNQTANPVVNATVKIVVRLPDGSILESAPIPTNASGIAKVPFSFSDQKPGELVPIEVTVTFEGITAATKASFRIWF